MVQAKQEMFPTIIIDAFSATAKRKSIPNAQEQCFTTKDHMPHEKQCFFVLR